MTRSDGNLDPKALEAASHAYANGGVTKEERMASAIAAYLSALPPAGAGEVVVPRKKFPVLDSGGAKIDWGLVAEHAAQAQRNHSQTVPELAGRGGLAWTELYAVLHNKRFAMMDDNEAMIACRALETRYLAAVASPHTTNRDSVILTNTTLQK